METTSVINIFDIGQHGKKSQAPRELVSFIELVLPYFLPQGKRVNVGVRNARKELFSDVAFKLLRHEGDKVVCYVRPPGVQEAREVELWVEGMPPVQLEQAFLSWWKWDGYISTNDLKKVGAVEPANLTDQELRELMRRLYLSRKPEEVRTLPGVVVPVHWQGVSLLRFAEGLAEYLQELGHDTSEKWLTRVVRSLIAIGWIELVQSTHAHRKHNQRRPSHRKGVSNAQVDLTYVIPTFRGEFSLFQLLGLIPEDAPFDFQAFAEAAKDHRQLVRDAYEAAMRAHDCRARIEKLRVDRERALNHLRDIEDALQEEEDELKRHEGIDRASAEQVALDLLRDRFTEQLAR